MANPTGPIADLSYRTYNGPLDPPAFRWWVIARQSMRMAIKKKGFWIWAVLSAYWYLILSIFFYFADTVSAPITASGVPSVFSRIVWKDQFLDAFSMSQLLLFLIALLIGAGSIANDNRANALYVYLSKPCTKLDYLIGKWFGIALPLMLVTAVPTLVFYGYFLLSYRQYDFVSQDPWLILRLLALIPIPAIFHASVCLGVSSLFNQGRLAGATYAGIYFLTNFATQAMKGLRMHFVFDRQPVPPMIDSLYYCSVDGIQIGLAKIILGTDGSPPFGSNGPRGLNLMTPAPSALLFFSGYLLICAGAIWIAWRKVRAVEVIGS